MKKMFEEPMVEVNIIVDVVTGDEVIGPSKDSSLDLG